MAVMSYSAQYKSEAIASIEAEGYLNSLSSEARRLGRGMGANPKREALMTSTKLDFVKPENKTKNIVTTNDTSSSLEAYVRGAVIISITMDTGLSDIATFHDSIAAFSSGLRAEDGAIVQFSLLHSFRPRLASAYYRPHKL